MWRWLRRIGLGIIGCPDPHWPLGRRGEWIAARYLRRKGYSIIEQGAASRSGEIDLIAVERPAPRRLVFVEIKTRTEQTNDHPADRVDQLKQQRITKTALHYLKEHRLLEHPCRFDVIAIWWPAGALRPSRIEHYENAFEATGHPSFFS